MLAREYKVVAKVDGRGKYWSANVSTQRNFTVTVLPFIEKQSIKIANDSAKLFLKNESSKTTPTKEKNLTDEIKRTGGNKAILIKGGIHDLMTSVSTVSAALSSLIFSAVGLVKFQNILRRPKTRTLRYSYKTK